jgi:hypothetical protein
VDTVKVRYFLAQSIPFILNWEKRKGVSGPRHPDTIECAEFIDKNVAGELMGERKSRI